MIKISAQSVLSWQLYKSETVRHLTFPCRRNQMNLSYSSWNRLTKKLRLHPYRVRRVHKITLANRQKRLLMGRALIQKPQVGRMEFKLI